MKIIEAFCQGKRDDKPCEDGYGVTDHFAAVADGSTSKAATPCAGGMTSGRLAMTAVLDALPSLPPEATKEEALAHFTKAIRDRTPDRAERPAVMRPTCSAAVFSRYRREVWLIGDCQCRFGGLTRTNPKLVDTVLTQIRCDVVAHLLRRGHTPEELRRKDAGRAFILDALREQTNFQNDPNPHNPYRYPVIDGTYIRPQDVPAHPVGQAGRLVLASDGYPWLADTLAETEAHLQRLLAADPLCYRENPATKCLEEAGISFDDRTFLSLEI